MPLSETLTNPEFTESYAIFVTFIFAILLYGGLKLYSTIVVSSWSISVIIFIGVGVYGLPIMLFYFSIITTVMLIALASMRYSQIN